MELTILNLVLITFIAGVVGGIVIADAMDTDNYRREQRRAKRKARHERRMREIERKNMRNIYIDNFGR